MFNSPSTLQNSCSLQPSPIHSFLSVVLKVAPVGETSAWALGAGNLGKPVEAQQELRVPVALGGTPLLLLATFVMRQKTQGNAAGIQTDFQTDLQPAISQGRGTYTMALTSSSARFLQLLKRLP